jgi:hypothetical protein
VCVCVCVCVCEAYDSVINFKYVLSTAIHSFVVVETVSC